jgi:hypothetical protein
VIRERELPLAASSTTLWRMKSEVYGWRLAPDLKRALAERAPRERVTVSRLLERIARESLRTQGLIATGALPFRIRPDR